MFLESLGIDPVEHRHRQDFAIQIWPGQVILIYFREYLRRYFQSNNKEMKIQELHIDSEKEIQRLVNQYLNRTKAIK